MEPPNPDDVATRADFIRFVQALAHHHHETHRDEEAWAHEDLGGYLEALAAWLQGDPPLLPPDEKAAVAAPTWRGVAIMLDAARVYE